MKSIKAVKGAVAWLLIISICFVFAGCRLKYAVDDGMFVGKYIPDDMLEFKEDKHAKLSIEFDGEVYRLEFFLTEFGSISCTGNRMDEDMFYTGKNPRGESFFGNIRYVEDGRLDVEIWPSDDSEDNRKKEFIRMFFKEASENAEDKSREKERD